jgi:hypothetical protein
MIPWFVVNGVSMIASLFGRAIYVRVRSGAWGVEAITLQPASPEQMAARLTGKHQGGPLESAALPPGKVSFTRRANCRTPPGVILGPSWPLLHQG